MIDTETKAKIASLYMQIDALYKEVKSRPSNMTCDICGRGDLHAKNGKVFKVKNPVHGYLHRVSQSPQLCHNHSTGWSLSHDAYNPFGKRCDEEIDLHFAQFIAKQLRKETATI